MKRRMTRKRIVPLVLAALLACLCGCAAGRETPTIRVGVALYLQEDTFLSTVVQNLEQLARVREAELGVKINLNIADARSSQASQNEQVDRFLQQGCDVICVNLVDRTAAAVIVDKAQAAGVPNIFFNRQPVEEDLARWDRAYYVGSKADRAGVLQGEIVLDAWEADPDALDRSGDGVLQYVMLEGEPGHQDTLLRTEHCVKTLTEAGAAVEKLASDNADWVRGQAALQMQQWLEDFGGAIEVVFANNDDMALGAIDACLSAGMTQEELPFIVGVDATPPALEAVAAGTLKGTVQNDAAGQAKSILDLCCALAQGRSADSAVELEDGKYVWLEYTAVTAENLEDFLPEV